VKKKDRVATELLLGGAADPGLGGDYGRTSPFDMATNNEDEELLMSFLSLGP
jgi:hypothetical protein